MVVVGIILLSVYATLAQPYRGGVQYQYVNPSETVVKEIGATVWTFPGRAYGEQSHGEVPDYVPKPTPTPAPMPGQQLDSMVPLQPEQPEQAPITTDVQVGFYAGWHDGGAPYSDAHIYDVVDCESTWRTVTGGYYLGLGQFAPKTWVDAASITGLWDWTSPYHQGYNMAVWSTVSDPGQQWPVCWWA